ncbi:UNVERIFIED_CONTAM: hypothetical protein FKN15_012563 [Acipenser sinensis]
MVAVLRHIQDIKKLQGGIDLLKKDKWGGSSHLPPEESWPQAELERFPASQEEFCAAPGADPVSSYVMATADRQMAPEGFLTQPPHKEFWGFCFPSEE